MKIEKIKVSELQYKVSEFLDMIEKRTGENLIFIGIPSGDYEEECFAVSENFYRKITKDEDDIDYLPFNPFYEDTLCLYMANILEDEKFKSNPLLIGHLTLLLNEVDCSDENIVVITE